MKKRIVSLILTFSILLSIIPADIRTALAQDNNNILYGDADGNGQVSCPQEEIAATISVSRVTVSRILNQLAREGLISLGYRSVQILDRPGLEALCE